MLIVDRDDRYRFVTQPAHAAVAGQFAERWGTDTIADPAPSAAVVAATYNHDNGWYEYDCQLHRDDDGDLIGFRDVPPERWVTFYEDGIDSVAGLDAYAGILASLHGSGIRRQRYGLSPEMPATDDPHYEAFVDSEERRQRRLAEKLQRAGDDRFTDEDADALAALHDTGGPPSKESRLWRNYALLQTLDTLSLAVCATLGPGEETTLPGTPSMAGGLTVAAVDETTSRLDPYPFGSSPLTVDVPGRTVAKDALTGDADLFERYYGAPQESLTVSLRPA